MRLADASDPQEKGVREGAFTFRALLRALRSSRFYRLNPEDRGQFRNEQWRQLDAAAADPAISAVLPPRLRLYVVLLELWRSNGVYERRCLFDIFDRVPLRWGPWRGMKRIFKEAEARRDTEMLGALVARLDRSRLKYLPGEVTRETLNYLVRRAWRFLRGEATRLPAIYADAAGDFLRFYPPDDYSNSLRDTWVANHIMFHESQSYTGERFNYWKIPDDFLSGRAYPELWKRTPRPLFALLERARNEHVRAFAVAGLKNDFPVALRDVETLWIARLVGVKSEVIDAFIVWLLENSPRFSQDRLRQLDLHEAVLSLLESESKAARDYAVAYSRVHARDMELDILIRLIKHSKAKEVGDLAVDLLGERDPRTGVGLDAWARLLGSSRGSHLAEKAIREHFGPRELTREWFHASLLGEDSFAFASKHLPEVHPFDKLGASFFYDLIKDLALTKPALVFAAESLLGFQKIDPQILGTLLARPETSRLMRRAVKDGRLAARAFSIELLKDFAYRPDYDSSERIAEIRERESRRKLLPALELYDENIGQTALGWLGDSRVVQPRELGVDWLLGLVRGQELAAREWASRFLIDSFRPADFAPADVSEGDRPARGRETLWSYLLEPEKEDDALRLFAIEYLKNHHPEIGRRINKRPVESGAEIPPEFLDFARVGPLFADARANLRSLAIAIGREQMSGWTVSLDQVLNIVEGPYMDARTFLGDCLLAGDTPANAGRRLDPGRYEREEIYQLCESSSAFTRNLGIEIIGRNAELAAPRELFRLTESPDRRIRTFVVRTIWSRYRDRGVTRDWKPDPISGARYTAEKKQDADQEPPDTEPAPGEVGVPAVPAELPAGRESLRDFLRRMLFELPPGRLPKAGRRRARPLSARRAKLALIETFRDICLEDRPFAELVTPLLAEFMGSRGRSEHEACMVALTRIGQRYPELNKVDVRPA